MFREYLFDNQPVIVQNTQVRESGSNAVMFAFYGGIIVPTPTPGVLVPTMCEDLDGNDVCDVINYVAASDSPTYDPPVSSSQYPGGFNFCYGATAGFPNNHGQSNLFCGANGKNLEVRNSTIPYLPLDCEDLSLDGGLTFPFSDGPEDCP